MKWLFGICIVLFSACQEVEKSKSRELTGHWHVYLNTDSEWKGCYEFIDFNGNEFSEAGLRDMLHGMADFKKQILHFHPAHGNMLHDSYRYEFKSDTILLRMKDPIEGVHYSDRFYALEVDKSECTEYEHRFSTSRWKADLPQIDKIEEFSDLTIPKWQAIMHLGYLKSGKSKDLTISDHGDRYLESGLIPFFLEKSRISVKKEEQDKIELTIYADKETKIKHLKPILQKLAKIPDRPKVVLVFQYNPQRDDFELFGKEVIFEGVDWSIVEDELLFSDYVLLH